MHRAFSWWSSCAMITIAAISRADDVVEDVTVRGSRANAFVSTSKESDAPREITDVASLVDALPGVHVRRLGSDDGFATLSIRGTASTQANVILAGIPLSGGADPSVDLSSLPLWPGARARVFRSFSPASFGQGSLGGTLALDPALAKDISRTEVWSAFGSFGVARLRAGDVRDLGRGVRIATGLSASRADDDYTYINPPEFLPHETTRQNARHADVNGLVSVMMPIALGPEKRAYLRVLTMIQSRDQHLPGTLYVQTPAQRLSMNRQVLGLELTVPAGSGASYFRAWGRREGRTLTDEPIGRPYDPSRAQSVIVAAGGGVGWRGRAGKTVRVDGILDLRAERFAPGNYLGPSPPEGATRVAIGTGVDVDWQPLKSLGLNASGRVDVWHDASLDPAIGSSSDARPTAHLGSEVLLGPVVLDAHGGAVARPPNFAERFGSSGGSLPTPDLRTESAWTTDIGAHVAAKKGRFSGSAELVGFGTWASDLITFVPVSARSVPKAINIGEARILGIEASAVAKFFGARVRASYTGLSTTNFTGCALGSCPPLPGRPAHDLAIDVSYTIGVATLRYGLDALAGMRADAAGTIVVPPRVLQSIGGRLEIGPRVTFAIDVRNLFDVRTGDYAQSFNNTVVAYPIGDAYAYPLPGRNFLASVRVRSE